MSDLDDDIKSVVAILSRHANEVGAHLDKAICAIRDGADGNEAFGRALTAALVAVSAKLSAADVMAMGQQLWRISENSVGRTQFMRALEHLGIANSAEAKAVLTSMPAAGRA